MNTLVKKSFLSVSLALTLSASANAFCIGSLCHDGYIGIGAIYTNLGDNAQASASGYGGYLHLGYESILAYRFLASIDGLIAGGVRDLKGDTLSRFKPHAAFLNLEGNLKFGVNILTDNAPLFISPLLRVEKFLSSGFDRTLYHLGGDIQGKIPIGGNQSYVLYGGGYTYIVGEGYTFKGGASVNSIIENRYNYGIHAHLGFSSKLSEHMSYYVKVLGKFYSLKASDVATLNNVDISYPATNAYSVMLEIGATGF
ncbi:hypothetical protein DCO58_12375 [Helicobacter saguini]|uniref:Outer membrane protein beta-barrel domain-containing protein n=1 Tax=Helicobacter saguini TaxID=1548018 RepID=A0A099BB23_9HELI|nr:hypothetical protein [Helicobacter saguini]MWV60914.1 hypothetical protein [Helicobacter saguini]MWV68418.1 hypothetical protein [Helicobacter saguini]MWV70118.1 hypothetical protein [Helicobacter saguini]MWV72021.1 hypothetical protein [Helicobacter saguini]TLD93755.1 hypothetical protein LS64_008150 [Helicobacter saguini]